MYAFIYSNKNDLILDSNEQIWTEHFPSTKQWTQNPNIKLVKILENMNQGSTDERRPPPPLTRQNAVNNMDNVNVGGQQNDINNNNPDPIIIDNNANARKIGSDCLRLSLAEAILDDKGVIFEMSPPV